MLNRYQVNYKVIDNNTQMVIAMDYVHTTAHCEQAAERKIQLRMEEAAENRWCYAISCKYNIPTSTIRRMIADGNLEVPKHYTIKARAYKVKKAI